MTSDRSARPRRDRKLRSPCLPAACSAGLAVARRRRRAASRGEAGFSLVEGLIAAALLLVIAVSVLPLFTRAMESNISGGRSSQMSTFVSADIEAVNQTLVDRDDWSVDASGGVLDLGTVYWDTGPLFGAVGVPDKFGDERWTTDADPNNAQGLLLWSRNTSIRKYSLSDLQILAGTDTAEAEITAVGHPMLLDTPLTSDQNAHLTEVRVSIKENRENLPVGIGRRITVGHIRIF